MLVQKGGSFNTILQCCAIDKIAGPPTRFEGQKSPWLMGASYQPPVWPAWAEPGDTIVHAARQAWDMLDSAAGPVSAAMERPLRLLLYRAVRNAAAAGALDERGEAGLGSWRWELDLWDEAQRTAFADAMSENHKYLEAHVKDLDKLQ
jgi:hypothetical protein